MEPDYCLLGKHQWVVSRIVHDVPIDIAALWGVSYGQVQP